MPLMVPTLNPLRSLEVEGRSGGQRPAAVLMIGRAMVFKKVIAVVCMIAGLVVLMPVTAPSAAAAAFCRGAECNGLDPDQTGCSSDAKTVRERYVSEFAIDIELRYSSSCNAVWTRITNNWGFAGVAKVIGYYNGEFRREELKTLAAYRGEVSWTRMITATWLTYGCYRHFETVSWSEWCTAGH
jgi:hypothetical protein